MVRSHQDQSLFPRVNNDIWSTTPIPATKLKLFAQTGRFCSNRQRVQVVAYLCIMLEVQFVFYELNIQFSYVNKLILKFVDF